MCALPAAVTPTSPPPLQRSGKLGGKKPENRLLADIRALIEAARQYTARTVNAAMVVLYWSVGRRIHEDILHQQRAEYGKQIISTLSKELTAEAILAFLAARHGTVPAAIQEEIAKLTPAEAKNMMQFLAQCESLDEVSQWLAHP